jgi:hypothetical protein
MWTSWHDRVEALQSLQSDTAQNINAGVVIIPDALTAYTGKTLVELPKEKGVVQLVRNTVLYPEVGEGIANQCFRALILWT